MVTFVVGAGASLQKSMFRTTCRYSKESVSLGCTKKSNFPPMFAQSARPSHPLTSGRNEPQIEHTATLIPAKICRISEPPNPTRK
jgi:hypothetical protein